MIQEYNHNILNDYIVIYPNRISYYGSSSASSYYNVVNKYTTYIDAFLIKCINDYDIKEDRPLEFLPNEDGEPPLTTMDLLIEWVDKYNPFNDEDVFITTRNGICCIEDDSDCDMSSFDIYSYCKYIKSIDNFIINSLKFERLCTNGLNIKLYKKYKKIDTFLYIPDVSERVSIMEEIIALGDYDTNKAGTITIDMSIVNKPTCFMLGEGRLVISPEFVLFNVPYSKSNPIELLLNKNQFNSIRKCILAEDVEFERWYAHNINSYITNNCWLYEKGNDYIKKCTILEGSLKEITIEKIHLSDIKEIKIK